MSLICGLLAKASAYLAASLASLPWHGPVENSGTPGHFVARPQMHIPMRLGIAAARRPSGLADRFSELPCPEDDRDMRAGGVDRFGGVPVAKRSPAQFSARPASDRQDLDRATDFVSRVR